MSELLNVSQTAAYFNVTTRSVHYWIKKGKLKATHLNGNKKNLYISIDEIAKYEEERNTKRNKETFVEKNITKGEGIIEPESEETIRIVETFENDLDEFSLDIVESLNNDGLNALDKIARFCGNIHSRQDVDVKVFNEIVDQIWIMDEILDRIYDELRPLV